MRVALDSIAEFKGDYETIRDAILGKDKNINFLVDEFVESAIGNVLVYSNAYAILEYDKAKKEFQTVPAGMPFLLEFSDLGVYRGIWGSAWLIPHGTDFRPLLLTEDEAVALTKKLCSSLNHIYTSTEKREEPLEILYSQTVSRDVPNELLEFSEDCPEECAGALLSLSKKVFPYASLVRKICVRSTSLLPVFFPATSDASTELMYNTVRRIVSPRKAKQKLSAAEIKKMYLSCFVLGNVIVNAFVRLVSQYTGIPGDRVSDYFSDCEALRKIILGKMNRMENEQAKKIGEKLLGNLHYIEEMLLSLTSSKNLLTAVDVPFDDPDFDLGLSLTWEKFGDDWFPDASGGDLVSTRLLAAPIDDFGILDSYADDVDREMQALVEFVKKTEGLFLLSDEVLEGAFQ